MPFKEVVAAGVYLVREALRSPNYVQGQQGWTINRDGSAEFSDVTARGTVIVGSPPGSAVEIIVNQSNSRAEINFYSGGSLETDPGDIGAQVSNSPTADQPMLFITSNEMGFDSIDLRLGAPTNAGEYGFYFINNSTSGTTGMFTIDGDLKTRLLNGTNLNVIGSTEHSFQIGSSAGINIAGGQQEFQARNNGAVTTLFLNRFGGTVQTGGAIAAGDFLQALGTGTSIFGQTNTRNVQITASTSGIQAVNNGAATSLLLNNAGGTVFCGGQITGSSGINVSGTASANQFTSNGSTYAAQINTNGGTVIGAAVLAAGNLQWFPPANGGSANVNAIVQGGGDYRLRLISSTRRHKENIRDLDHYTPEQILSLTPKYFQRNDEQVDVPVPSTTGSREDEWQTITLPVTERSPWYVGFIAEEAAEAGLEDFVERNNLVPNDQEESITGFTYAEFAAVGHQIVLRDHEARIAKLEALIEGAKNGKLDARP